ncbi:MAG TPA: hypothetical protein VMN36_05355 [Verrucomicrobiales bacterium]|nr:hypothetical protein [Verrucomicrobiales bacterium]
MDATALPSNPPPVHAGPAKSSAWPLVLGILGIIFALGALLGSLSGFVFLVAKGPFVRWTAPGAEAEMMAYYTRWTPHMAGFGLIAALLAALLLTGSIALLRRRRYSVRLLRTWAVGKGIYAIVYPFWMMPMQRESFEIQRETMPTPPGAANFFDMFASATPIIAAFQVGWFLVFPIIVLLLLAMPKIREETRTWP